jgi:lysophospholipase L1-like esterase
VTVWLAVNDLNSGVSLDTYAAELDTLLTQLDATHARVLVGNVPDLSSVAAYHGLDPVALRAAIGEWNQAIADVTARHGDTLVDLYSHWQQLADHPEYVAADGFHPSSEGYQALADVFAEAL